MFGSPPATVFDVKAFVARSGVVPARSEADRWQQVALLGMATLLDDGDAARVGLGAALCALDHPAEAGRVLASVSPEDPWGRWWATMAVGQVGALDALDATLHAARAAVRPKGADGRDVSRMLADVLAEVSDLSGNGDGMARFTVLGHAARPVRRALIGGRSSAVYLVDPSWESLKLVRFGPSDGPSSRNGAHLAIDEIIELVRRGDAGAGRRVPTDTAEPMDPDRMLDALHDDPKTRDAQLLRLAEEVREERRALMAERERLEEEWSTVDAEKLRARKARERAEATAATATPAAASTVTLPTTADEAAALLGVNVGASRSTVQRHWRELLAGCHPDRVSGLHPLLVERAQDLSVALNRAREILLPPARSR